MRELHIAYGNSSHARRWRNVTITWDELVGLLLGGLVCVDGVDNIVIRLCTTIDFCSTTCPECNSPIEIRRSSCTYLETLVRCIRVIVYVVGILY